MSLLRAEPLTIDKQLAPTGSRRPNSIVYHIKRAGLMVFRRSVLAVMRHRLIPDDPRLSLVKDINKLRYLEEEGGCFLK